jgi:hypothetical protein
VLHFFNSFFGYIPTLLKTTILPLFLQVVACFQPSFISLTVDLELELPMPPLHSINHSCFSRISPTHYVIKNVDGYLSVTTHVGQIADYLNFEEHLRIQKDFTNFQSISLGYLEFAQLWNTGVSQNDICRLSNYSYLEGSDTPTFEISSTPLSITEFFITPDQVGLHSPSSQPQLPSNSGPQPRPAGPLPQQNGPYNQRQYNKNGFQKQDKENHQRPGKHPRYFDYVPVPFGQQESALSRLRFQVQPRTHNNSTTSMASSASSSSSNSTSMEGLPTNNPLPPSDVQDAIMQSPTAVLEEF